MFTGIVAGCGVILDIEQQSGARRFLIQTEFDALSDGESIAIDGVCLTVTSVNAQQFFCDLSPETLDKTIANQYQVGQTVNLERALLLSDRVGGHFVSGHVDECATVKKVEKINEFWQITFELAARDGLKYIISKGSIAINGVSLTINQVDDKGFDVMVIPHTLKITHLDKLKAGDSVNIEYDMLAKLVAKQVEGITVNV